MNTLSRLTRFALLCFFSVVGHVGTQAPNSGTARAGAMEPTRVYELAEERGIDREIVDAALSFEDNFGRFGERGFRAVCLLIETGNHDLQRSFEQLKLTNFPGAEKLLIPLCEKRRLPNSGSLLALKSLGLTDTVEVREYLLARLEYEKDPKLYFSTAVAAARLKEAKAVGSIGKQLLRFDKDWGDVEPYLLHVLHIMGNKSSNTWLKKYVQSEKATSPTIAVDLIARTNLPLAKRLAVELLEKRPNLDELDRLVLDGIVNDRDES